MDSLRRLVQAIRLASSASERRTGLPVAQSFVLATLARDGGLSLLELAAATRTDPSSASVVVSRLEERGLVGRRRDAEDGRKIRLAVTAKGHGLLRRAPHPPQEDLIAALTSMSAADRRRLGELLERLADAVGRARQAPPMFHEERGTLPRAAPGPTRRR